MTTPKPDPKPVSLVVRLFWWAVLVFLAFVVAKWVVGVVGRQF